MPFAHNDKISTDPIEGGIQITDQQYKDALAGMMQGKVISIEGGLSVSDPIENEEEVPEDTPLTLEEIKKKLVAGIDDHISSIYSQFTRFETEYVQREAAARAFKAADYEGDAGVWVTAFADSAGMETPTAANLIIQQADILRAALQTLGALRMQKYGVQSAANEASARSIYAQIIADADAVAATL